MFEPIYFFKDQDLQWIQNSFKNLFTFKFQIVSYLDFTYGYLVFLESNCWVLCIN